jgi:hypothetical protein
MNNQSREHSVSGLAKEPNGMCLIRCASLLAESGTCRTPPGRVGERGMKFRFDWAPGMPPLWL